MANLPDVFGVIAEGAELLKSGGLSAGRAVLNAYLKKRSDQARDILFDELKRGGLLPEQVAAHDDGIAVIHGYNRAAWEGRARVNLRLLARAITGQLLANNLVADEFFLYAESLAGLSRDEIIFIATLLRHSANRPDVPEDQMGEQENLAPWLKALEEMSAEGWNNDKTSAVAGRCLRSGFVILLPTFDRMAYKVSPMLTDLCKTVDFDDALRREP
ncbi:MAG: hypothetical protein AAB403_12780 [Planctomycetota bacterium]